MCARVWKNSNNNDNNNIQITRLGVKYACTKKLRFKEKEWICKDDNDYDVSKWVHLIMPLCWCIMGWGRKTSFINVCACVAKAGEWR